MINRFAALAILAGGLLVAGSAGADGIVDLTVPGAMQELRQSNPQHFERIQAMIAGLREEPERVEGDWLQVNFDVEEVDLSEFLMLTSMPPRQSLAFTLDDTRYRLYVVRTDLTASVVPAY